MWDKPSICMSVPVASPQLGFPGPREELEEEPISCPRAARAGWCQGGFQSPDVLLCMGWRELGGGSPGAAVTRVCAGQGMATSHRCAGLGEVSVVCLSCSPRAC